MERNTRQRLAIRDAIAKENRPLLPNEVLVLAQQDCPGMGIATVYRNLKAMVDEGELWVVALPNENPRFELAGHEHHHHFQCKACQKVFDIHACVEDVAKLVPAGFVLHDHDITLYGLCQTCSLDADKHICTLQHVHTQTCAGAHTH